MIASPYTRYYQMSLPPMLRFVLDGFAESSKITRLLASYSCTKYRRQGKVSCRQQSVDMLAESNIHYFLVRHNVIPEKYFLIYAVIICIVFVPLSDTKHEDRHAFLNFSRAKYSKCLLERNSIYLKLTRKYRLHLFEYFIAG